MGSSGSTRRQTALRVDDTIAWTFSRAVPLLDAAGEIVEWLGTASDVSERKRAGAELAADLEVLKRMQALLPEDLQRAADPGFERHLAKPPSIERLEHVLRIGTIQPVEA